MELNEALHLLAQMRGEAGPEKEMLMCGSRSFMAQVGDGDFADAFAPIERTDARVALVVANPVDFNPALHARVLTRVEGEPFDHTLWGAEVFVSEQCPKGNIYLWGDGQDAVSDCFVVMTKT